jgi:hypothetical protein
MLFTEPIIALTSLYSAFIFSVLFTFLAAFPYIFRQVYGFNASEIGLIFLAIGLGVILSVVVLIIIDRIVYMPMYYRVVKERGNAVAPEHRLYMAMVGGFGIIAGLFWFG